VKISMLIRQCCIRLLSASNFNGTCIDATQEERRSIFPLPLAREFANKGPYKTFQCNEIGDCVRCAEWINRNRLSDTRYESDEGTVCEI